MKHPANVTLLILGMFFLSQLVGLFIFSQYLSTGEALPLGLVRPDVSGNDALVFILAVIFLGTVSLLILLKFNLQMLIRVWLFFSIAVLLTVSFSAFIAPLYAFALSVLFAIFKVFRFNVYLHNISELFIYGSVAVLFSPILNVPAAIGLLVIISLYDMIAVWKSKHMVYLAKSFTDMKYFPGISVPYSKPKSAPPAKPKSAGKGGRVVGAILGGGDMAFPLIFSGVVLQELLLNHSLAASLLLVSAIPVFATLGLAALFAMTKKDRFYPAMPFVTVGCLIGYAIIVLI